MMVLHKRCVSAEQAMDILVPSCHFSCYLLNYFAARSDGLLMLSQFVACLGSL